MSTSKRDESLDPSSALRSRSRTPKWPGGRRDAGELFLETGKGLEAPKVWSLQNEKENQGRAEFITHDFALREHPVQPVLEPVMSRA